MSETLTELKSKLRRGDKRELARRMQVAPSRISDALDGFVKDDDFLSELQAEIQDLTTGRDSDRD